MIGKILITGADGQIGSELTRFLSKDAEIIGLNRRNCDLVQLDRLDEIVRFFSPDVMINSAGYTAVDRAESEPELAQIINCDVPKVLANIAKDLNIPFIHLSTDYVFNGRKCIPYLEDDLTDPLSIYGKTKLAGEQAIAQVGGRYLNLRTAWVYSCYGKRNFVKTMLKLGENQAEIRVVADQIGTPTWAKTIAMTIGELIPKLTQDRLESGTYHLTNSGVASWYDFAVAIFEEARRLGFPLAVKNVIPITTAEYPTIAVRPAYSVLSNYKLDLALDRHLPHWQEDLSLMLQELKGLS